VKTRVSTLLVKNIGRPSMWDHMHEAKICEKRSMGNRARQLGILKPPVNFL
jgi:hypothetical protein